MKGTLWYVLAAAVVAGAAGCDDEGGTTGPQAKALDFTLSAPTEIATKGFVDIEVRVTDAVLVNYPLTVTFEEANQDQSFAVINTVLLQKPEDTIARSHEDAARTRSIG